MHYLMCLFHRHRQFTGALAKNVRVALTAFYDSLILCCETMHEFGPPHSDKYEHH